MRKQLCQTACENGKLSLSMMQQFQSCPDLLTKLFLDHDNNDVIVSLSWLISGHAKEEHDELIKLSAHVLHHFSVMHATDYYRHFTLDLHVTQAVKFMLSIKTCPIITVLTNVRNHY